MGPLTRIILPRCKGGLSLQGVAVPAVVVGDFAANPSVNPDVNAVDRFSVQPRGREGNAAATGFRQSGSCLKNAPWSLVGGTARGS